MNQILAATHNQHKIAEFQEMLTANHLEIQIVNPSTFSGFPELIENGETFEANSAMKAEQAAAFAKMTAFADDSGLAVDALHGAPGIYSARYAGENATDADRIAKLLNEMKGVADRTARFVCVISIAHCGKRIAAFRGEVVGTIAQSPAGSKGFGYDPVFIPAGYNKTFAELGADVKDKISHRARAFEKAIAFLRDNVLPDGGFKWS